MHPPIKKLRSFYGSLSAFRTSIFMRIQSIVILILFLLIAIPASVAAVSIPSIHTAIPEHRAG
jgi:hypothetical protein